MERFAILSAVGRDSLMDSAADDLVKESTHKLSYSQKKRKRRKKRRDAQAKSVAHLTKAAGAEEHAEQSTAKNDLKFFAVSQQSGLVTAAKYVGFENNLTESKCEQTTNQLRADNSSLNNNSPTATAVFNLFLKMKDDEIFPDKQLAPKDEDDDDDDVFNRGDGESYDFGPHSELFADSEFDELYEDVLQTVNDNERKLTMSSVSELCVIPEEEHSDSPTEDVSHHLSQDRLDQPGLFDDTKILATKTQIKCEPLYSVLNDNDHLGVCTASSVPHLSSKPQNAAVVSFHHTNAPCVSSSATLHTEAQRGALTVPLHTKTPLTAAASLHAETPPDLTTKPLRTETPQTTFRAPLLTETHYAASTTVLEKQMSHDALAMPLRAETFNTSFSAPLHTETHAASTVSLQAETQTPHNAATMAALTRVQPTTYTAPLHSQIHHVVHQAVGLPCPKTPYKTPNSAPHAEICSAFIAPLQAETHLASATAPLPAETHSAVTAAPVHTQTHCAVSNVPLHTKTLCAITTAPLITETHCAVTAPLHTETHCAVFNAPLHTETHFAVTTAPLQTKTRCVVSTAPLLTKTHRVVTTAPLHTETLLALSAAILYTETHCAVSTAPLDTEVRLAVSAVPLHAEIDCEVTGNAHDVETQDGSLGGAMRIACVYTELDPVCSTRSVCTRSKQVDADCCSRDARYEDSLVETDYIEDVEVADKSEASISCGSPSHSLETDSQITKQVSSTKLADNARGMSLFRRRKKSKTSKSPPLSESSQDYALWKRSKGKHNEQEKKLTSGGSNGGSAEDLPVLSPSPYGSLREIGEVGNHGGHPVAPRDGSVYGSSVSADCGSTASLSTRSMLSDASSSQQSDTGSYTALPHSQRLAHYNRHKAHISPTREKRRRQKGSKVEGNNNLDNVDAQVNPIANPAHERSSNPHPVPQIPVTSVEEPILLTQSHSACEIEAPVAAASCSTEMTLSPSVSVRTYACLDSVGSEDLCTTVDSVSATTVVEQQPTCPRESITPTVLKVEQEPPLAVLSPVHEVTPPNAAPLVCEQEPVIEHVEASEAANVCTAGNVQITPGSGYLLNECLKEVVEEHTEAAVASVECSAAGVSTVGYTTTKVAVTECTAASERTTEALPGDASLVDNVKHELFSDVEYTTPQRFTRDYQISEPAICEDYISPTNISCTLASMPTVETCEAPLTADESRSAAAAGVVQPHTMTSHTVAASGSCPTATEDDMRELMDISYGAGGDVEMIVDGVVMNSAQTAIVQQRDYLHSLELKMSGPHTDKDSCSSPTSAYAQEGASPTHPLIKTTPSSAADLLDMDAVKASREYRLCTDAEADDNLRLSPHTPVAVEVNASYPNSDNEECAATDQCSEDDSCTDHPPQCSPPHKSTCNQPSPTSTSKERSLIGRIAGVVRVHWPEALVVAAAVGVGAVLMSKKVAQF